MHNLFLFLCFSSQIQTLHKHEDNCKPHNTAIEGQRRIYGIQPFTLWLQNIHGVLQLACTGPPGPNLPKIHDAFRHHLAWTTWDRVPLPFSVSSRFWSSKFGLELLLLDFCRIACLIELKNIENVSSKTSSLIRQLSLHLNDYASGKSWTEMHPETIHPSDVGLY